MREIIFRGQREDNGEWVYGFYVKDFWGRDSNKHGLILTDGGYCEVKPETVGQYTGFTDKNNMKIFEGDIVKDGWGKICIIRFGKGYFDSGIYEFYGWYTEYLDETERNIMESLYVDSEYPYYKVISNIHDNPELLEVEK